MELVKLNNYCICPACFVGTKEVLIEESWSTTINRLIKKTLLKSADCYCPHCKEKCSLHLDIGFGNAVLTHAS